MLHYFTIIESILRDRMDFFMSIRDSDHIWQKIQSMIVSSITFLAIYGGVMGLAHSPMQALSSVVKLPILFLLTLLICTPSLYFFNLLFGARHTLPQNVALILTAITVTSVLLLSFAPITLFFLMSSSQYEFFKLLNVIFFGISGAMGVVFFRQGITALSGDDSKEGAAARKMVFVVWVLLYGFVGTQMAWTLSPFMGEPGQPFIIFRQIGGNFYSDVFASINTLLRH